MPKLKNLNKYKENYRKAELRRRWRTYSGDYMYCYDFLGGATYFRHPKTTAECRESIRVADEHCKIRPKRNHKNLPTAWDDIRPSRRNPRSWKDHSKRRHQYLVERTINDNLVRLALGKNNCFLA